VLTFPETIKSLLSFRLDEEIIVSGVWKVTDFFDDDFL
jgi:hypothetical protein